MRIYLIGMPGSGKTTLGYGLAKHLNMPLVDMDKVIEEKEGRKIADIFAKDGESYFRDIERLVLHEVSKQENVVISCGGGVPCFFDNADYMNSKGDTVFIDVSPTQLFERMLMSGNAAKRPLLNGKENEALLKELQDKLSYRRQFYTKAKKTITGDCLQVEDLILAINAQG